MRGRGMKGGFVETHRSKSREKEKKVRIYILLPEAPRPFPLLLGKIRAIIERNRAWPI